MSKTKNRSKKYLPPSPASQAAKTAMAPAHTTLPPLDPNAGGPDRPVLMRLAKLRYAYRVQKARKKGNVVHTSALITIPKDILEVTGLEVGMTIMIEGYRDGRVRMFPAGDMVSREDKLV